MLPLGPNGYGEYLQPGRVTDCYLGILLDQPLPEILPEPGSVLVVAPAALLHREVPQPHGRVLYDLVTGHPDRAPQELVFLADLTVELRAWPQETWTALGISPEVALLSVVELWRAGQVRGLELGGVSAEEARALGRPPMDYVRGQLRERLAEEISRQYLRWLHPTSRHPPDETLPHRAAGLRPPCPTGTLANDRRSQGPRRAARRAATDRVGAAMELGRVGIWTYHLNFQPTSKVRDVVAELESLGYGAIWVGESAYREPLTNAAVLLSATSRVVVATGIANIWVRDPFATLAAQLTLAEAYPERFLLGLGVSHAHMVEGKRGHHYRKPFTAMQTYLDAMDRLAASYWAVGPVTPPPRVLAALGPKMLALAAERAQGAHPYLVPPELAAAGR